MRKSRGLSPLPSDGKFWLNRGAVGAGATARLFTRGQYGGVASAFPVDVIRAYPFSFPTKVRITTLKARVSVLAAGGLFRASLYNNVAARGTMLPNALLWDSGNLPSDAVGNIDITLDYTFLAGARYWVAHHAGVLAATFVTGEAAASSAGTGLGVSGFAGSYRHGIAAALAFGAPPSTWSGGSYETALTCPFMYQPGD